MNDQFVFIKQGGVLKRLDVAAIIVLEAADNYTKFIEMSVSYTARVSFDNALAGLPEGSFVRIHKSYAVALRHIEEVSKDFVVAGGHAFPVSGKYYPELISRLHVIK